MNKSSSWRKRVTLATVTACALTSATSTAPPALAQPTPIMAPAPAPHNNQLMALAPIAGALAVVAAIIGILTASTGSAAANPPEKPSNAESSRGGTPMADHNPTMAPTPQPAPNPGDDDATGPRAISPDDGGVVSTKGPDSGSAADPGYDLDKPTPGHSGMTVSEARAVIADALNERRAKKGLPPLNFPDLAQSIAEDEAVILGKEVTRIGRRGLRQPNVNNWVANYPELRNQSWWNDHVAPAAWVQRSIYPTGPTKIINQLGSTTKAYSNAGVGVWRDPVSGDWFFALAFFG